MHLQLNQLLLRGQHVSYLTFQLYLRKHCSFVSPFQFYFIVHSKDCVCFSSCATPHQRGYHTVRNACLGHFIPLLTMETLLKRVLCNNSFSSPYNPPRGLLTTQVAKQPNVLMPQAEVLCPSFLLHLESGVSGLRMQLLVSAQWIMYESLTIGDK